MLLMTDDLKIKKKKTPSLTFMSVQANVKKTTNKKLD